MLESDSIKVILYSVTVLPLPLVSTRRDIMNTGILCLVYLTSSRLTEAGIIIVYFLAG